MSIFARCVELSALVLFPIVLLWHWSNSDWSLARTIPHTWRSWRTHVWKQWA